MKKLFLGLLATVLFSVSSLASNGKVIAEKEIAYSMAGFVKQSHSDIVALSPTSCLETVTVSVTVTGSLSLGISSTEAKVEATLTFTGSRVVACNLAAMTRTRMSYEIGQEATKALARKLEELKKVAMAKLIP